MEQEKIATKLILADGTILTVGTRGNKEQIALKLTAKTDVKWEMFNISIQDLSDGTEQIVTLSANGECRFEIPIGNLYSIVLPFVDGYTQPNALKYTASIASRNIEYSYDNLNEYLTIRIAVRSEAEGHTTAMFNGLEVVCKGVNGVNYTGIIQNGQVTILIPFGIAYTISMPQFDGLAHNHTNETFLAGLTARNLVYSYIDYNNLHVYGLDADGNAYTIADIQKMGVEVAAAKIVACAYNNATLANAQRKDGGVGCGICWEVKKSYADTQWATKDVDFGADNPIIADAIASGRLKEGCGYYIAGSIDNPIDGDGESSLVVQVARELDSVLDEGLDVPIFTEATNTIINIGGIERRGFVPSEYQLKSVIFDYQDIVAFYNALNIAVPKFTANGWWTSLNAKNSAILSYSKNFESAKRGKTDKFKFIICFSL